MSESIPSGQAGVDGGHWPDRRELAGIIAWWGLYGTLSVVNGLFPPGGPREHASASAFATWGLESLLWMFATPIAFWLTSRFSTEGVRRPSRIAVHVVAGLLLALAIAFITEVTRGQLPLPILGGPAGTGRVPASQPLGSLTRGRFLSQAMIGVAVFAAGVARDYVMRYKQRVEEAARLRAELAEARLAMLRSQLNPHFLYNTLNAISALVDRDPRGVRRMIARLSDLLRTSIEPTAETEVTLARELEILEPYLEILRIRFQGRLETSVDVPEQLRDALVPPLILQPLLENAMKHAVGVSAAPGHVGITARREDDALVLVVSDSGAGDGSHARANAPARASEGGGGVGLRNVRARLAELYGRECGLTLAPRGTGTDAMVRLPYHTPDDLRTLALDEATDA
jgi:signal transduction histidine kinase